jgi:hypothetical protein
VCPTYRLRYRLSRGDTYRVVTTQPTWLRAGQSQNFSEIHRFGGTGLQDVTPPGEEAPRSLLSNIVRVDERPWTLLSRYSSLAKLLRVTALCVRFFRRCRWRDATDLSRAAEIRDAKLRLIRCEQRRCYSDELSSLRKPGSVSRRSSLLRLYPVLDPAGTMLVGGRLSYSHVPFSERHPPILPKTSPLAELFIRNAHAAMLHASATLTTSYLMRQVWIPGAQSMVKRFIRSCVPCFRFRPRHGGQLMGQLPSSRVTPARPFSREVASTLAQDGTT